MKVFSDFGTPAVDIVEAEVIDAEPDFYRGPDDALSEALDRRRPGRAASTLVNDDNQALEPIFISVKQTADMLGVTPAHVYYILDRQEIESRYIGRRRLVVLKSLRAYAENLPRWPSP